MREIKQNNDEAIQTLIDLGLTNCQARIYVTLVQNRNCTAEIISQISKVTRQDVYRIMPKLEKSGLARKLLGTPIEWEATPLKDGLVMLIEIQSKHFLELQAKTMDLLNNFKEMNKRTAYRGKESEFVIIPGGEQQRSWWKEKIEKLHTSWDGFTEFKDFSWAFSYFGEYFKKPLDRGVKFRNIFYAFEDKTKELLDLDPSFRHANVQNQFISSSSNFVGMVLDGNEACLYITGEEKKLISPLLWSNDPVFVAFIQEYFETMWNKAVEDKNEEH